ncbi:uncharacterized protein LOC100280029 [Zea mays]|uniref:U6 snRNA-associated Sm-like protein LSm1 n=1 Tax=Zea mays TaxID=4577 RepID=B8A1F5_MAIZE|nr:uncharacterized protein LOC100280029 [Zea mays]ACL54004.1 unknown [Zea mays]ACN31907.1 unknown [Zea mays]|eukprot:NP_001146445.1 uncharacterized LOC100280029 [Zea mays]
MGLSVYADRYIFLCVCVRFVPISECYHVSVLNGIVLCLLMEMRKSYLELVVPRGIWRQSSEKLIVLLRDGRKLLGTLCSFDQFANVVLQGACERVIVGEQYCDVPLGLYVIRGENVVLIGELDREKDELPAHMTCVSEAEIRKAEKAEREARDLKGTMRKRMEFLDFD